VPAVNIGTRQGGREHGHNVAHAAYERGLIAATVRRQIEHGRYARDPIFGDGSAGSQIADVLATAEFRIQKRLSYVV